MIDHKIKSSKQEGMVPEENSGQGLSIYSFMKHPLAFFHRVFNNDNKAKIEDTMLTYKTEEGDAVYWSVDKCEGSHLFFGDDSKPTPVTEAIIKLMIALGVPKLTKSTVFELYRRVKIYEHLSGHVMFREGSPIPIRLDLLKQFIGAYHTGERVSPTKFRTYIELWVMRKIQAELDELAKIEQIQLVQS